MTMYIYIYILCLYKDDIYIEPRQIIYIIIYIKLYMNLKKNNLLTDVCEQKGV